MAGFGTAGCVLACAAALFVSAGAFVGFRGWPQVGGQGSPATLAVTPGPASGLRPAASGLGAAFVTTVVPVANSRAGGAGAGNAHGRQGTHDKVSAAAGGAVSGAGSRLGSAVGGSTGAAVTKIAGGAGGAVSKLGAGVANLLG
jgi:hypothetical protein